MTEYIEIGSLNGLFVLGRTIGFIGKEYMFVIAKDHSSLGHSNSISRFSGEPDDSIGYVAVKRLLKLRPHPQGTRMLDVFDEHGFVGVYDGCGFVAMFGGRGF